MNFPARSLLYQLRPAGLETDFAESLPGYFSRLGIAHCVSPAALFRELAKVYGLTPQIPSIRGIFWARVVEMLCEATKLDLTVLTGRRWPRVRKDRLYRSSYAWCPRCITELDLHHHPLLWQFAAVEACHHHGTLLVSRCPGCHEKIGSVAGLYDYRCQRCGFDMRESTAAAATERGVRDAGLVAELVSSPRKYGNPIIERRGDGRGRAFRLARLLDVCREDGTTLVELLKSDTTLDSLAVRRSSSVSVISIFGSQFEAYKLRQSAEIDIFSLDQIETEFGVTGRTARKWQTHIVSEQKRMHVSFRRAFLRRLKKLAWYRDAVDRELASLVEQGAVRDADSLREAERRVVGQRPVAFRRIEMLKLAHECLVGVLRLSGAG